MKLSPEKLKEYEEWIESEPRSNEAKELLRKYFPGESFNLKLYLLGVTEDGGLLLSPIYPGADYEGAMASKIEICKDCINLLSKLDE